MSSSLSEDKTFWLKYNIYTQELSEEDEIKTEDTIINTIICQLFVNFLKLFVKIVKSRKWK